MKEKEYCDGIMEVIDETPCTIFTKCNKCGRTDNFSVATRHYGRCGAEVIT